MILKIAGVALISAIAFVLLKKDRADFAFVLEVCATTALLLFILPYIENLLEIFTDLSESVKLDIDFKDVLIKVSGIAVVSRLICELCKDAGENALAVKFELTAKVLILISAIPVFEAIYNLITAIAENLL